MRPSDEALAAMPSSERERILKEWESFKKKEKTKRRRDQRKRVKALSDEPGTGAAEASNDEPAAQAVEPAKKKRASSQQLQPPAKQQRMAEETTVRHKRVDMPQEGAVPPPEAMHSPAWASFGLCESLLRALADLGFEQPTPIQAAVLPAALGEGRDIIGAAETGSGKTLAFGLPILQRLMEEVQQRPAAAASRNEAGLRALVLCPTRELAMQVADHLGAAGRHSHVRVATIVGGMAPEKQLRVLSRAPEIVVATPGRLWELISQGEAHLASLASLRFLVLDEADRMVEKGHFAELTHVLDLLEAQRKAAPAPAAGQGCRQTFVFSATLTVPPSLRKRLKLSAAAGLKSSSQKGAIGLLMERVPFEQRPRVVDVTDRKRVVASKLEEAAIECSEEDRDALLLYILTQHPGRTLVFANAISAIRRVAALLALLKVPHAALHAQMQQRQRLKALDRFKRAATEGGADLGHSVVLVATDVAARGIDVEGVRTVIHYQVPPSAEAYVHRAGRTARGGADGVSILLATPVEKTRYSALLRALSRSAPLPEFPVASAALEGARKRVLLASKIDRLRHARAKAAADQSWMQRSAAELEIELEEPINRASRRAPEEAGQPEERAKREAELTAQLEALLAAPLDGRRLGGLHMRSGKYPTSGAGSGLLHPPAGGPSLLGGEVEALAALRNDAEAKASARGGVSRAAGTKEGRGGKARRLASATTKKAVRGAAMSAVGRAAS